MSAQRSSIAGALAAADPAAAAERFFAFLGLAAPTLNRVDDFGSDLRLVATSCRPREA